jgi:hypothetical protein
VSTQTTAALLHRLSQAGFKKDFVRQAILPDWWDESCADDLSLLEDLQIRTARFLGCSVSVVKDPGASLTARSYPRAQLRRVRDVNRDRLGPAIHTAIQVASAAVRNLRPGSPSLDTLPLDALQWRKQIARSSGRPPTLKDIAGDLWNRGIPVIPLDTLPSPGFQGMACVVENRPVILLGYKYDEPGRAAFLMAHEAGHVAVGDCEPNEPVIDEEDEITDDADLEKQADLYATQLLMGDTGVPQLNIGDVKDFKGLALRASELERKAGADASAVIFTWARRTGDYAMASMAVRALYRNTGARKALWQLFDVHVDIADASETDRFLLRCVHGERTENEVIGGQ